MSKLKIEEEGSTEEKIKAAARRLFTERGFDAVKTRDIAEEAGINQALLNYYFRSKQKLFDLVMIENFNQFVEQIAPIMGNETLGLEEILINITGNYIDLLKSNPDLPFFILNEMRSDSPKLTGVRERMGSVKDAFIKRIEKKMKEKNIKPIDKSHLMMNFMSMIIFPFLAQPVLMRVNKLSPKEFNKLMDERKTLIPRWLNAMMSIYS